MEILAGGWCDGGGQNGGGGIANLQITRECRLTTAVLHCGWSEPTYNVQDSSGETTPHTLNPRTDEDPPPPS